MAYVFSAIDQFSVILLYNSVLGDIVLFADNSVRVLILLSLCVGRCVKSVRRQI